MSQLGHLSFRLHRRRGESRGNAELAAIIIGLLLIIGISHLIYTEFSDNSGDNIALADVPAAPWLTGNLEEWPRFVLSNRASFQGHSALDGGTSFLLEYGQEGNVAGATAQHLLTSAAGVEPRIPRRKLNQVLREWTMYLPNSPEEKIQFNKMLGDSSSYGDADALFLECDSPPAELPVTPLRLFRGKVWRGEPVYLAAIPYMDGSKEQHIYPGKVRSVGYEGDLIMVSLETPVKGAGLSGAPLINGKGYAIAILTGGLPDADGRIGTIVCHGLRPLREIFTD